MLEWTGERFVPWIDDAAVAYEHMHRYAYAAQFVPGKRVLDMGSGEGYGAALLARHASEVVGIDIDPAAIDHARGRYERSNLSFQVAPVSEIPFTDPFDVIVCFETLEHVEAQRESVSEARRLLKPGGLFIVSTPEKRTYSEEPHFDNPFHTRELYFEEFRDLLAAEFSHVRFMGQRVMTGSSLWPVDPPEGDGVGEFLIERTGQDFQLASDRRRTAIYYVALASNSPLPPATGGSVLLDRSNALLSEVQAVRSRHVELQKELEAAARQHGESLRWQETQIQDLKEALRESQDSAARYIQHLEQTIEAKDGHAASLEQAIREKEATIQSLEQRAGDLDRTLTAIQTSRGWRFVLRVRAIRRRLFGGP